MSNAAKLKKKAAEFEQKKQFDKALQTYLQALEAIVADEEDADVALHNRVGDLFMRENNVTEAMKYYDRAVDLYAEGGFYNNAIALCNKILRLSPGRNAVYYKLGRISARKGFINDAKQNFLEYAHRMQTAGQLDEAFRALKEFADLVPDQEDVRLMLAEQLTKQGRTAEAVEQLQRLYEKFEAEGRGAEMRATADRLKKIGGPELESRPAGAGGAGGGAQKTTELVFLDLGESAARPPRPAPSRPSETHTTGKAGHTVESEPVNAQGDAARVPSATRDLPFLDVEAPPGAPRSRGEPITAPSTPPDITPPAPPIRPTTPVAPLDSREFAKLRLPTPLDLPAVVPPVHDLVIPGELPSLDASATPPGPSIGRPLSLTPEMTVIIPDEPLPPRSRTARPRTPTAPPPPLAAAAAPAPEPEAQPEAIADAPPVDWDERRQVAEAMFEAGDRAGGLRELDAVMEGLEGAQNVGEARSVVEEILRIDPNSVRHHQKRVEYAVRSDDVAGLPEIYLTLGDALFRDGQLDAARAVYRRVLELSPNDARAVTALSTFGEAAAPRGTTPPPSPLAPAALPPKGRTAWPSGAFPAVAAESPNGEATVPPEPAAPVPERGGGGDFVNLGDWLRDEEAPKSTRMVIPEHRPTGDEEADFASMLQNFKAGVAQNVELDDSDSHFDLGVAYKEMGLLDEAIAEFQRALQGPGRRVRTLEALGQCFLEKRQAGIASTILSRALQEKGVTEEQLVGVLYLLGYAAEALRQPEEAVRYYQRVFAVDIDFRDVARRLSALEQAAR